VRRLEDNLTSLRLDLAKVLELDSDFASDRDGRRTFTEKHIKYFDNVVTQQKGLLLAQSQRRAYEDSDAGTCTSLAGASSTAPATAFDVFDADACMHLCSQDLASTSSRASISLHRGRSSLGHLVPAEVGHAVLSPNLPVSRRLFDPSYPQKSSAPLVMRHIEQAQQMLQAQRQRQQLALIGQQQSQGMLHCTQAAAVAGPRRSRRMRGGGHARGAESEDEYFGANSDDDFAAAADGYGSPDDDSDSDDYLEHARDLWEPYANANSDLSNFHGGLSQSTRLRGPPRGMSRQRSTSRWEDAWSKDADELLSLASTGALATADEVAAAAVAAVARRGSIKHSQSPADLMQPYDLPPTTTTSTTASGQMRSKSTHHSRQGPAASPASSASQQHVVSRAGGASAGAAAATALAPDSIPKRTNTQNEKVSRTNAMRVALGLIDSTKLEHPAKADTNLNVASSTGVSSSGMKPDPKLSTMLEEQHVVQEQLTEELLELSSSLKSRVTSINKSLKEDAAVLEKIDAVFDENQPTISHLTKRISDHLWASGFNCCSNIGLVVMTIIIFWFTFLVIRIVPKF